MSGPLTPRELIVAILVKSGRGAVLGSLVDASLHRAVMAAVADGSAAASHPGLAGHRPDALTGRRMPGLDEAVQGLVRDGALQWRGSGWALRSGERSGFGERLAELTDQEAAALDALARRWRGLVSARRRLARTAAAAG